MTPKKSCGCAGAKSDPREEGAEIVWHDPTKYDPARHGPPYLPVRLAGEAKAAARRVASLRGNPKLAQWFMAKAAPLSAVLSALRAASFLHQTHHWQTSGPSYYGDHLLFDRLYKESQPHIDQVAEKAVGLGSVDMVTPARQAEQVHMLVRSVASADASAASLVAASLKVEALVLSMIDAAIEVMGNSDSLTQGTSNLLQGVADLHETFVYLLQQRASASYDYAR